MKTFMNGRIAVKTGDITLEDTDAIVNAANSTLMGGGGVDGAIHRAGGPAILDECRQLRKNRYPGGLLTGEAVATTGGHLTARHVIHTVGPVWHGGSRNEESLLANCYRKSLDLARELGCTTIAFPAISTGVYRFPRERAAEIASETVRNYLMQYDTPETVVFVFFRDDDEKVFLQNASFE